MCHVILYFHILNCLKYQQKVYHMQLKKILKKKELHIKYRIISMEDMNLT